MYYFWKVILDLVKNILPWQTCFIWREGGCLRLELPCIPVNTVFQHLLKEMQKTTWYLS